jgi:hypothetical protein
MPRAAGARSLDRQLGSFPVICHTGSAMASRRRGEIAMVPQKGQTIGITATPTSTTTTSSGRPTRQKSPKR